MLSIDLGRRRRSIWSVRGCGHSWRESPPMSRQEEPMSIDRSYIGQNSRERDRMRAIAERLTDEELADPVNDSWTVAGVLGHIAFWDGRALALGQKLDRGDPFTVSDTEPEDVDWINDASRPLIHAIPPREAA